MKKNALLLSVVLLLALASAWLFRARAEDRPQVAQSPSAALADESPDPSPLLPPATVTEPATLSERVPLEAATAPPDDSFSAALSGVTGRLVEPDGRPVAGQDVALLEICFDEWWAFLGLPGRESPPELVVARDRSGSDGRFHFSGARPSALHALAGSTRSPRVPLRLIAEALEPGKLVELGDVVLPARAALAGRVVDERGAPVEGARVRAGFMHEALLEIGLAYLEADGAILVGDRDHRQVIAVPPWFARLEERMGLASTTTDAEGRFTFDEVPAGMLALIVDRRDHASAFRAEVPVGAGVRNELEDLVLPDGRTLRGRVVEHDGTPVVGAEVLASAPSKTDFYTLVRGAPTDEAGRFEIRGVPAEEGEVALVARPDPLSPWALLDHEGPEEELELRLEPRGTLAIRVTDETGGALADASIELTTLLLPGPLRNLVRPPDLARRLRQPEPGLFVLEDALQGDYVVHASSPGLASGHASVQLAGDRVERTIRLRAAQTIAVRVLDASGEGVSRATLTLFPQGDGEIDASVSTDSEGRAELELPPTPPPLVLRIEHPAYAPTYVQPSLHDSNLEVRLSSGGSLRVRMPGDETDPSALLFFNLRKSSIGVRDEANPRPLFLVAGGEASLSRLTPGTWRYEHFEGWSLDAHLLSQLPEDSVHGDVEVFEGQTSVLELGD